VKGAFRCLFVCVDCGAETDRIMRTPVASWDQELQSVTEEKRECVRQYLRGIYQRAATIRRLMEAKS